MADLMTALRNAHNAGDTEAATRIAAMIKNQQQPQEAAPAAPTVPATAEPQEVQDQSLLERGFNAVGQVAASGGRMIAGAVADTANIGVGIGNAALSAADWAAEQAGGNIDYRIPAAGYGSLDAQLMPRGTGEQVAAGAVPYILGGEVVAPLKAAEGAGRVARTATSLANQLPASIAGVLSEHNQGNDADQMLGDLALNAVAGSAIEKVGGAAVDKVRRLLPESMGGYSAAQRAAEVANPDYINSVLQGGDQDAQAAFRTATTDEAGNSILNPSQVMNTEGGRRYIAAEQRDLTRGTASEYGQRLEAQKGGEGITRAVEETALPVRGDVSNLQGTAQDVNKAFRKQANENYETAKTGAQDLLNTANISQLKMPQTKGLALQHLEDNAATGGINLTAEARKTLKQFSSEKNSIKSIDDLDQWKRTLNEKAQKAYRAGDFTSYNALKDVSTNLKGEADDLLSQIHPEAGSLYQKADQYYSIANGDFGDKSVIGKIASKENPDTAANALIRGQNANYNTQEATQALRDAITNNTLPNAQGLGADLASGLGDVTRSDALRAATTGENFSPTKFANTLSRTEAQAAAATDLARAAGATRNELAINQALRDAISTQRNRAVVPSSSGLVANLAGRATGGGVGMLAGGPVGGVIGQEIGGRVSTAINQGLLDRIAGTSRRGNEIINFLSDPANAQQVDDILRASNGEGISGANADQIAAAMDSLKNVVTQTTKAGILDNQQPTYEPVSALPTRPQKPEPAPQPEPEPEPEQQAQAAKKSDRFKDVSPQAIDLYKAVAGAETGGLDNRFIRTKAAESGVSTAYGPAQITGTLAQDFKKNHSKIFTKEELNYLDRFIQQANKMKKADANDPVYGYGGAGDLTSPEDQKLYAQIAVKMLDDKYKSTKSLDKTVMGWRGNDNDKAYFAKVRDGYKAAKAQRQGWGKSA